MTPRPTPRAPLLIAMLGTWLLFVGCGTDAPEPISHPERITVWAEFMEVQDIDPWFAFAGAAALNVNVAIKEDLHDRSFLRAVCRAAEDNALALRLWPLLSQANGYWANQQNVEAFITYVQTLRGWAAKDCPRLEGFVVDLEMPYDRAMELQDLFAQHGSVADLLDFLLLGIDEDLFEAARLRFTDLVQDLGAQGYLVSASTMPMIVDDAEDGDESIAKALWTPVQGVPYDKISFQVYRTHYDAVYGQAIADGPVSFPSGLITSYASSIVAHYGDQGAIDLGIVGSAGVGGLPGMTDAAQLQGDIAAALAAGIPPGRIQVFSLDGLFEMDDRAAWITLPEPAASPVDASTLEIRELFNSLDLFGD